MRALKTQFQVTDRDGVTRDLVAVRPTQAVRMEAEIVKSRAWGQAASKGAALRSKVKDIIAQQGLWDEAKQKKLEELDRRLAENEAKLPDANGKVRARGLKKSDIRDAAFQIRRDRAERVSLLTDVTGLYGRTAEGISENAEFDFLVSRCVLDAKTEKPYFASLEDYHARADDPDAVAAAEKYAEFHSGWDKDFDKGLPENKFLVAHGFVDADTLMPKVEAPKEEAPAEFDFEDDLAAPAAAPV